MAQQPQMGQPQRGQTQGQPQMGQSQQGDQLLSQLETFSLPAEPIKDSDIPQIKTVIQQVVSKITETIKGQQRSALASDFQPIMSGVNYFKNWLTQQKCVQQVTIPYMEIPERFSSLIFISFPGQIPINIVFKMEDKKTAEYRMLLFASTTDILRYASFIENKK